MAPCGRAGYEDQGWSALGMYGGTNFKTIELKVFQVSGKGDSCSSKANPHKEYNGFSIGLVPA